MLPCMDGPSELLTTSLEEKGRRFFGIWDMASCGERRGLRFGTEEEKAGVGAEGGTAA